MINSDPREGVNLTQIDNIKVVVRKVNVIPRFRGAVIARNTLKPPS